MSNNEVIYLHKKITAQEKIEKAFIELIQTKDINEINVTDLVRRAKVNRSTFYVNYLDIYDLVDKIKEKMYFNVLELYKEESIKREHSYNYLTLFQHIKENQIYYRTLFKLNFDFSDYYDANLEEQEALKYFGNIKNIEYHREFFKAGIHAVIQKWLENGCQESATEMVEILNNEYKGKSLEN